MTGQAMRPLDRTRSRRRTRVVVIVASPSLSARFVASLQAEGDITVVGQSDAIAAAAEMVATLAPDVVILDLDPAKGDAQRSIQHIMRNTPTPILALSDIGADGRSAPAMEALAAGAVEALPKPSAVDARLRGRRATACAHPAWRHGVAPSLWPAFAKSDRRRGDRRRDGLQPRRGDRCVDRWSGGAGRGHGGPAWHPGTRSRRPAHAPRVRRWTGELDGTRGLASGASGGAREPARCGRRLHRTWRTPLQGRTGTADRPRCSTGDHPSAVGGRALPLHGRARRFGWRRRRS